MTKNQSDIIIVGAGLAGVVAAIELLEAGKKVLIIDRDRLENMGGLAKWAFGGMFFVDTKLQRRAGFQDSVDRAMNDWFGAAEFEENEKWGKLWAEQFIHTCTSQGYHWLKQKGIKFFPVVNWVERGLEKPGNSVPRFHMVWGTGWELTKVLNRLLLVHLQSGNLSFLFEHRVLDVIMEGGTAIGVCGVKESNKAEFEAYGNHIIVATGGINGSIEKVRKNWSKELGTPPQVILNGAHKFAYGDLHDAIKKQNGHIVNLDLQWNYAAGIRHPKPRKVEHGMSLVPCPSALWVNYEGKRFEEPPLVSGFDTRYLVQRICSEPVQYSWQIMNRKIAHKEFAISGSESNPLFRDKKFIRFVLKTLLHGNKKLLNQLIEETEDIIVGNSIEELVQKMNALTNENHVKTKNIRNSIEPYDAEINRGESHFSDLQLKQIKLIRQYKGTRTRTSNFVRIMDKRSFPLIAIRSFIVSRKSMGGIQTNLDCEVMSIPDQIGYQQCIPGLYAIGESAGFGGGGMHGKRSLEGTFLAGCIITARKVAEKIIAKNIE